MGSMGLRGFHRGGVVYPATYLNVVSVIAFGLMPSALSYGAYSFAEVVQTHFGPGASQFGNAIAGGEDVNGDGYPDYVLGDPGSVSGNDKGRAVIYSGRDASFIAELREGCPSAYSCLEAYGRNVALLGDLTGDGKSEIAVASNRTRKGGVVDILEANGNLLARIEDKVVTSNPHVAWGAFTYFPLLGHQITPLGDLNGDQVSDFAISTIGYGFTYKTGGSIVGPSGQQGQGGSPGGPGFPPPPPMPPTPEYPGQVRVYSGVFSNGQATELYRIDRPHSGEWDRFGFSVQPLGDLDNDGASEIAIGAPGAEEGYVLVVSGSTGDQRFFLQSKNENDEFGHAVANIGDYNGDGLDDLAVGSPGSDLGCSTHSSYTCHQAGRFDIYSGATHKPTSTIFVQTGFPPSQHLFGGSATDFGGDIFSTSRFASSIASYPPSHQSSVPSIYDPDLDGVATLVIGAPGFEVLPQTPNAGAVLTVNPVTWESDFVAQSIPGFGPMDDWASHPDEKYGKHVVYAGTAIGNGSQQFLVGSPGDYEENSDGELVKGTVGLLNYGDPMAPLLINRKTISIGNINSSGEQSVRLTLHAGEEHANKSYFLFGSSTGTTPGTPIYTGMILPLNSVGDPYFEFSQWHANTESLENTVGSFNEKGSATAHVRVFSNVDPVLSGLELDFAYVVFDPVTGLVLDVSNAVRFEFEN